MGNSLGIVFAIAAVAVVFFGVKYYKAHRRVPVSPITPISDTGTGVAIPTGSGGSGGTDNMFNSGRTGAVPVVPAVPAVPAVVSQPSSPESLPLDTTAPSSLWISKGCWRDDGSRTLKNVVNIGSPFDYNKCYQIAMTNGHHFFARQADTWCTTGNDDYSRIGPSGSCNFRGKDGTWANSVFQIVNPSSAVMSPSTAPQPQPQPQPHLDPCDQVNLAFDQLVWTNGSPNAFSYNLLKANCKNVDGNTCKFYKDYPQLGNWATKGQIISNSCNHVL